jgi:hypothetical protein
MVQIVLGDQRSRTRPVEIVRNAQHAMRGASRLRRVQDRRRLVDHTPSRYITGNTSETPVGNAQKRAIQNYRSRLGERGLARFEVLGRDADRDLIRSLARRLAEDTAEASELRAAVKSSIAGAPPQTGGILAALRRSPLVGADLDLSRPREEGRDVDL